MKKKKKGGSRWTEVLASRQGWGSVGRAWRYEAWDVCGAQRHVGSCARCRCLSLSTT